MRLAWNPNDVVFVFVTVTFPHFALGRRPFSPATLNLPLQRRNLGSSRSQEGNDFASMPVTLHLDLHRTLTLRFHVHLDLIDPPEPPRQMRRRHNLLAFTCIFQCSKEAREGAHSLATRAQHMAHDPAGCGAFPFEHHRWFGRL